MTHAMTRRPRGVVIDDAVFLQVLAPGADDAVFLQVLAPGADDAVFLQVLAPGADDAVFLRVAMTSPMATSMTHAMTRRPRGVVIDDAVFLLRSNKRGGLLPWRKPRQSPNAERRRS